MNSYIKKAIKNVALTGKMLADNLGLLKNDNNSSELTDKISTNLEYFLCWTLEIADYKEKLWCDGFAHLDINHTNEEFTFAGEAWIGPTSDGSVEYKCEMSGTVKLTSDNKVESYFFEIIYQKDKICICDKDVDRFR